jgi:hypothetical protein
MQKAGFRWTCLLWRLISPHRTLFCLLRAMALGWLSQDRKIMMSYLNE